MPYRRLQTLQLSFSYQRRFLAYRVLIVLCREDKYTYFRPCELHQLQWKGGFCNACSITYRIEWPLDQITDWCDDTWMKITWVFHFWMHKICSKMQTKQVNTPEKKCKRDKTTTVKRRKNLIFVRNLMRKRAAIELYYYNNKLIKYIYYIYYAICSLIKY